MESNAKMFYETTEKSSIVCEKEAYYMGRLRRFASKMLDSLEIEIGTMSLQMLDEYIEDFKGKYESGKMRHDVYFAFKEELEYRKEKYH